MKSSYRFARYALIVCALSAAGLAQTINTVAGNGTAGFTGDGSAATSAQLNLPFAAVSVGGSLYIADQVNNRVRVVSSGGTISTLAGNGVAGYSGDNGKATAAGLANPSGILVDGSGNVYIADTGDNVIRKVTSGGTITTFAGTGNSGIGGDGGGAAGAFFTRPSGLALDSGGNFYIADTGNNSIRKVAATTNIISTIAGTVTAGSTGDNGPATKALLSSPQGLAVDSSSNLYVCDTNNNVVRRITPAGIITTVAGNYTAGFSGDGGLARFAQLSHPRGVAVDAAGDIFIADTFNNRVRVVAPNGVISTVAGSSAAGYTGDGDAASKATLNQPSGLSFDSAGKLYISDNGNSAIRVYSPSAVNTGTPPSISAGGVISASSFGGFNAIAPGSWIEIYGSNLAAGTQQWGSADFQGSNAPTALGGTGVTVAGLNAYVDFVSPTQVNAQVPAGVGTGTQKVVVSTGAGSSAAFSITVNLTEPGVLAPSNFTVAGKQYVGAVFTDNTTFVMPPKAVSGITSRQAHPGETITIYAVGFGLTTAGVPGQITPQGNALTLPFAVLFGQTQAQVLYAGLAPGAVGLYQFNVVVPNVAANDAIPITFLLSGAAAPQTLFTAVQ